MKLTEKELEDTIFYQQYQNVKDTGLAIFNHDQVIRQLSLGSFGRPDLLGIHFQVEDGKLTEIYITIYELKSGHVSYEAICQVMKYRYALDTIFRNNKAYTNIEIFYETALIGHSIESSVDFMSASAELEIRLFTYQSTPKGVIFERVQNYQYKADQYEKTWLSEGKKLDLLKLFAGAQEVIYDPDKDESWISNK